MPTVRPRTQITHTPGVERALEIASGRWPGERPGELLVRLIEEGARAVAEGGRHELQDRQRRVAAIAGKYGDLFGPGYLDRVREGWPE